MDSCDVRIGAYKNNRTFEDCRKAAASCVPEIIAQIRAEGRVYWEHIMEKSGYDAVVYKLILKYLRQEGFDIGNHSTQYVQSHPA